MVLAWSIGLGLEWSGLVNIIEPLSKCSLVYLLVWHPPLHTPYISSPNDCLLFASHAHTIATCFAVVPTLCNLILVSLSTLYWDSNFLLNVTHPSDHSLKCHIIFFPYRPGLTSMKHTTSHTTLLINDVSQLLSNSSNRLNLSHPIRTLASTASASPSTLNMSLNIQ